jgi:mannose-6-phosphate isomerase
MDNVRETPWGKWEVLLEAEDCKVKRMTVKPGHRLSYQTHQFRQEVWTVISGTPYVILDDVRFDYKPNDVVRIPQGAKHRIGNAGDCDVVIIEVQMGSYFGEDDIVRLEDDYARN